MCKDKDDNWSAERYDAAYECLLNGRFEERLSESKERRRIQEEKDRCKKRGWDWHGDL